MAVHLLFLPVIIKICQDMPRNWLVPAINLYSGYMVINNMLIPAQLNMSLTALGPQDYKSIELNRVFIQTLSLS